MTHDEIIRLAREVADPDIEDPVANGFVTLTLDEFESFAAAVIDHKTAMLAKQVQEMKLVLSRAHSTLAIAYDRYEQAILPDGCTFRDERNKVMSAILLYDTISAEVLREHDRQIVERCAKLCEPHEDYPGEHAAAIRALKDEK